MERGSVPVGVAIVVAAVAATSLTFLTLRWQGSDAILAVGFWYEDAAFALPDEATARLGGPLEAADLKVIEQISRAELERAFAGLRIAVTDNRRAFWRVEVREALRRRGAIPVAGESYVLGPLGGQGAVGFVSLALNGIQHAPPDATRETIVEGIGRGIGRAAAHEFAHQILGATVHNTSDRDSYEYPSSDRASQFYGELRWTTAWPLLERRVGY